MERKVLLLALSFAIVVAVGAVGYAVGVKQAAAPDDAATAKERAYDAAHEAASQEAFSRSLRNAAEVGERRGARAATDTARTVGGRAGERAVERQLAATEPSEPADPYAAAAAGATPEDPASLGTLPDGTCPEGFNYSMGTCTTYDPNSCGPGEIRVHATLECIPRP